MKVEVHPAPIQLLGDTFSRIAGGHRQQLVDSGLEGVVVHAQDVEDGGGVVVVRAGVEGDGVVGVGRLQALEHVLLGAAELLGQLGDGKTGTISTNIRAAINGKPRII